MTPIECGNLIKDELRRCAAICRDHFGWTSIKLEIRFDVRGTVAGYAFRDQRVRFNLPLLMEQTPRDVHEVAAHEFAHIAVYRRWKEQVLAKAKLPDMYSDIHLHELCDAHLSTTPRPSAHGAEWRAMMYTFGWYPKRTHHFDVTNHRVRRRR